jgi:hypothetical protein
MGVESALLSGLFSGAIASLVSALIEKYGGNIGGILGSSPTTFIPACIGLWSTLTKSSETTQQEIVDFQKAMFIVCPGMIVNGLFLYSWKILPSKLKPYTNSEIKLLLLTTFISLCCWFAIASIVVLISEQITQKSIQQTTSESSVFYILTDSSQYGSFYLAVFSLCFHLCFGIYGTMKSKDTPSSKSKITVWSNILRGLAASVSIFLAVLLGSINPIVGGITSLFPAIFGTAMVSVWLTSGSAVSLGAVEPLILGSLSVSLYAFIVAFMLPAFDFAVEGVWGIIITVVLTYLISIASVSYPCFKFIQWRLRVNALAASNNQVAGVVDIVPDGRDSQIELIANPTAL